MNTSSLLTTLRRTSKLYLRLLFIYIRHFYRPIASHLILMLFVLNVSADDLSSTSIPTKIVDTAIATANISIWSLFPGLDGNALIGAFSGASLVALGGRNIRPFPRVAYMAISMVIGYLAAPEVLMHSPLHESAVAAFFASATAIALVTQGLKLITEIELPFWMRRGRGRGRNFDQDDV